MKTLKILLFTLLTTISIAQSFGEDERELPEGAIEYLYKVKNYLESQDFIVKGVSRSTIIAIPLDNSRNFLASFFDKKVAEFALFIPLTDYAKKNPKELLEFLNVLNASGNLIRQHYVYDSKLNYIIISLLNTDGYNEESFDTYLLVLDSLRKRLIREVKNNKKFTKLIKDESIKSLLK